MVVRKKFFCQRLTNELYGVLALSDQKKIDQ